MADPAAEKDGSTRGGRSAADARALRPGIRFINLDRATKRRRFMEDQGARLGLAFERVPAVAAADIAPAQAERLNNRWERPLSPAELGCFLSHRAIWREVAAGDGPILVLEDDVILSRGLTSALPRLAALTGVDLLNIETFERRRFVGRQARLVAEGLSVLRVYRDKSGSAAYLLWPAGALKLLARAERGAAPVDAFLHGLQALVSFQSVPALAIQIHLAEKRGLPVPIPAGSSIQMPRERLSLAPRHLAFHKRRLATQLRLAGQHAMRLFGRRYRLVDIVEADFVSPDHRRS